MSSKTPIVVAKGDGVGPEIMEAVLHILDEAGANLDYHPIEIGEKVYLSGNETGIPPEAWELLKTHKVFLKAPITTPQGGGYKSVNVATRKTLGLYANVRPAVAYTPFVSSKFPGMDLVIVRENEEDLYAGIEHQQTPDQVQSLKIITKPGSEKICHYAFEFARRHGRKKVTCFTKDNIMKRSDGLFHRTFEEVAKEYPDIENEHWIVDIGMAKMAASPENFDVIVMPNLYGDIASDITAQIAGSVGLAGSANIGDKCAMFEAIHGSAPRRAGQGVANPSALLHGAIMMLNHLEKMEVSTRIHNAWLRAIEDGIHTYDIVAKDKRPYSTMEFAKEVVSRLGKQPQTFQVVDYTQVPSQKTKQYEYLPSAAQRELIGADIAVYYSGKEPLPSFGERLQALAGDKLEFQSLSCRGVKVYPEAPSDIFTIDHLTARFMGKQGRCEHAELRNLLQRLESESFEWLRLEGLYQIDGKPAFS